jgi:hypothetical protein
MQDDPDDKRGLLKLISTVLEEIGEEMEQEKFPKHISKNLGTVDKMIRYILKKNAFSPEDYGLLHLYIQRVGCTEGTIDYAIKRMHDNMSDC